MLDIQKLIEEYSPEYCAFLEATYTDGMMSEGGVVAIERLFDGVALNDKTMLDIGSGLGGVVFYLAEKYNAQITGFELSPWLVEEAARRTPNHLKHLVRFVKYEKPPLLPFPNDEFDIVFSKGVLTHVKDKLPLFNEIYRTLKSNSIFVVDDWLSPFKDKWGKRIQRLCELDNLTLYAETETNYQYLLQEANFRNIEIRNENKNYAQYNREIVERLKQPEKIKSFTKTYGEQAWQNAVAGYQLITEAIEDGELLIRRIKCIKK